VSSLRLVLCAHVDSRLVFYPRRWGISEALRVNLGDGITVVARQYWLLIAGERSEAQRVRLVLDHGCSAWFPNHPRTAWSAWDHFIGHGRDVELLADLVEAKMRET